MTPSRIPQTAKPRPPLSLSRIFFSKVATLTFNEGEDQTKGSKRPKIEAQIKGKVHDRGKGSGEGLGEPLPRESLRIPTWNRAIWCIVEAKRRAQTIFRSQPNSARCHWERC